MARIFQLVAGHPVLDFVNTLDYRFGPSEPIELLPGYGDLLGFVRQSGLAADRQVAGLRPAAETPAAAKVLESAHELREALATWFYTAEDPGAPRWSALGTLQHYFLDADHHRELAGLGDDEVLRVAWTWGRFEQDPRLPVRLIARAAAELLTSEHAARIHQCKSATCRWLFLDMSRNHTRRWCDMKICGNRMKARRFQRRLKPESSPAAGSPAPSTGSPRRSSGSPR